MKTIARISILFLLIATAGFSPAQPADLRFCEAQKYYTGDVKCLGNDFSNDSEVCHDFNGDGAGDLFFLKPFDAGNPILRGTILFGSASGSFPSRWDFEIPEKTYNETDYNYLSCLVLDVNGDGFDDFLTVNYAMPDYRFDVYINIWAAVWEFVTQYCASWSPYDGLTLRSALAACDCNGDKFEEFMVTSLGINDSYAQPVMVMPAPFSAPFLAPTYLRNTSGFAGWTDAGVGDFNGDGLPDFFERSYYSGVRIHAGDGGCTFHLFASVGTVLSGYARKGNFNGDQYDDFIHTHEMMCTPSGYYAAVMFGGSDALRAGPSVAFPYVDRYVPIVVADANVDGLDDVGMVDNLYSDTMLPIYFYRSEGETFSANPDTLRLRTAPENFRYKGEVFSWDFNLDGRDDLLYFIAPDTIGVVLQEGPIATLLQNFAVRLETPGAASIEWRVSGDAGCEAFRLSRLAGDAPIALLASIDADPAVETYRFVDTDISKLSGREVIYRLESADADGSISFLAEQSVTVPGAELALHQNYPNPFNPGTVLSFTLPEKTAVTLDIFDVSGRLVRRLAEGREMEAGRGEIFWDGRNDEGRPMPSGVYYCRLAAGKATIARKLVLAR